MDHHDQQQSSIDKVTWWCVGRSDSGVECSVLKALGVFKPLLRPLIFQRLQESRKHWWETVVQVCMLSQ